MKSFITKIHDNVFRELSIIKLHHTNTFKQAQEAILILNTNINALREEVRNYDFPTSVEEIKFFKFLKPDLCCELFYYKMLSNIEIQRPYICIDSQKKYLESELFKIETYFSRNVEFHAYLQAGMNHFDTLYFVRGNDFSQMLYEPFDFEIDSRFSTHYDLKVSYIRAFEMLSSYIKTQIATIDRLSLIDTQIPPAAINMRWTDHKISLTESIYALHESKCFNNGEIYIKEIASALGFYFHIDMDDFYHEFSKIKSRAGQTKFIDILKSNLLTRINKETQN